MRAHAGCTNRIITSKSSKAFYDYKKDTWKVDKKKKQKENKYKSTKTHETLHYILKMFTFMAAIA